MAYLLSPLTLHVSRTPSARPLQTKSDPVGNSSVHRAKFLDAMVKHVPKEISHFGKRLSKIEDLPSDSPHRLKLIFEDESTFETDVVLGCDGIHSKVRGYLDSNKSGAGAKEGSATLQWSGSWAFRGALTEAMPCCPHQGRGR